LNVLNVIMSLDPVHGGGTVERTVQMSLYLIRHGVSCTVLTTDIGLTRKRVNDLAGINIVRLKTLNKRYYLPILSPAKIRNYVRSTDIIHLMNHWTFLNAVIYLFAWALKKPYVMCPAGTLSIFGRSKKLKKIYNLLIGKRIIRNAWGLIAISTEEINQFCSFGVERKKIVLIPNGIDPASYQYADGNAFKEKYGIGKSAIILFVGRLNSIKGPDLLLKAFHKVIHYNYPQYCLVFAGPDGGMLSELRNYVTENHIGDRVHFVGYLGERDKASAFCAADFLVIPSRQEAMSIVVLEAGIAGTPVLLTDQCGFDIVDEIKGGKVVPASVAGLQLGLTELLGRPENLKAMGKRLYDYILKNYAWDKVILKYIEMYDQILKSRAK